MSDEVHVEFEDLHCEVHVRPATGTDPARLQRMLDAAKRSCVVRDSLVGPVHVETAFRFES